MNIVSAEIGNVDASTIVIVFDERVQANQFIDGWIVYVNNSPVNISNAQIQADRLSLYLTIPECISTDVITLSYIVPPVETNTYMRNNNIGAWGSVDWRG